MYATSKLQPVAICLLLLLFSMQALAAGLEARLDRTRIAEGETVVLILNVPGDSSGTPDISALARDFDILNRSQSMQMSMINGRSSSSRGWQFVLAPKRTGKLSIPAIRVDGASTRPLELDVLPAAQAAQLGPAPPVLLEVDAEPKQPLVQQKVIYTVRLLSRAPLRQPRISEPEIKDALVEPLGRETEYSSQRDGQQYRVIERRYAVFPQRSGALEIDGPVLSAQLPEQNQRGGGQGQRFPGRDPFADFDRLFGRSGFPDLGGAFAQGRPIQLRARQLVLDVQPQPAGAPSPWLPAESLTLNDSWSPDPPVFRVGEPVTRTIAITAQGLSAAQLPELTPEAPAAIKVYPERSQVHSRVDGDTVVAQKVITAALVPAHAGRITLPEMRLAWWDTRARAQQVARLPAREVEVLPAAAGAAPSTIDTAPQVTPAPQPRAGAAAPAMVGTAGAPAAAAGDDRAGGYGYWPWVAAILALAWLLTIGLWLRARRNGSARPVVAAAAVPPAPPSGRTALAGLEKACRENDAAAARASLLNWAEAQWPQDPPRGLDSLAQRLGEGAATVLHEIDRHLYAAAVQPWDGIAAWGRLSPVLQKQGRNEGGRGSDSALPPLYPQGA